MDCNEPTSYWVSPKPYHSHVARPRASSDVFRAIADPTRRHIIDLLAERPRTAGELAGAFDSCQSTVSEHLGILRRAGLVTYAEHLGRRTYELTPAPLREAAEWSARWRSR
jgi:DNA-binding transcriptional ArsR family regulator